MIDWLNRMFGQTSKRRDPDGVSVVDVKSKVVASESLGIDFEFAQKLYADNCFEAAAEQFEALVACKHDWADAYLWLGICRLSQGQAEDAYDALVMALHFEPRSPRARYCMALAEQALGRTDDALNTLDAILDEDRNHADAYNMRGGLRLARNDLDGARLDFECAVASDPLHIKAHSNLGSVLCCDFAEYGRGARHIERALELDPGNRAARSNLALILYHRGDDVAALDLCNQLIAEDPGLHEARLHRALLGLRHAKFETAWDDYESRKLVRSSYVHRNLPWPEWEGDDLREQTILIVGEQGLGDEVMFASCFREIITRAKHTVIECSPRLHSLFRRSFREATVLPGVQSTAAPSWLPDAPQIDVYLSAGSLPRHFRRQWNGFPSHQGYLVPDAERVRRWRDRLSSLGAGLKVGLSWRGGLRSTRGAMRSIDLVVLATPLSMPGLQFVDLQYGDTVGERAELSARGIAMASWPDAIVDLDETAALIANLDVVVTVCTTVVHLSGALGRDVCVLVPSVSEWRYLAQGERMPWYPSARLFRQREGEGWEPAITRLASALSDRIRLASGGGLNSSGSS